jgi:hypothetical protein
MILADVFMYLFLVLGFLVTVVCYWLLFEALFHTRVERLRAVYHERPVKAALVGLLITAPALILGSALASAPNGLGKLLGVATLLLLVLTALYGSTGLAVRVGEGLASAVDAQYPWTRALRGGSVLAVTFILPLLGWFVVLPLVLVSGIGAAFLARRRRNRPPAPAPATLPDADGVQA